MLGGQCSRTAWAGSLGEHREPGHKGSLEGVLRSEQEEAGSHLRFRNLAVRSCVGNQLQQEEGEPGESDREGGWEEPPWEWQGPGWGGRRPSDWGGRTCRNWKLGNHMGEDEGGLGKAAAQ